MTNDLIPRSALLRRVPVNRKDTGKTAWDWGPTRILSPEKYEIIKPYIGEE